MFADIPGQAAPFSLHNIVLKNKAMTPTPDSEYKGEVWFAPSVIAKVLRYVLSDPPCVLLSVGVWFNITVQTLFACMFPQMGLYV